MADIGNQRTASINLDNQLNTVHENLTKINTNIQELKIDLKHNLVQSQDNTIHQILSYIDRNFLKVGNNETGHLGHPCAQLQDLTARLEQLNANIPMINTGNLESSCSEIITNVAASSVRSEKLQILETVVHLIN